MGKTNTISKSKKIEPAPSNDTIKPQSNVGVNKEVVQTKVKID